MLLFTRDKAPDRDSAADKNNNTPAKSAAAYRRTSIPSITSFDRPSQPNLSHPSPSSVRRAPLASLDPQAATNVPLDFLMPSTSTSQAPQSSRPADAHAESSKDADRSADTPRYTIGRPISINRALDEDSLLALQNTRRRSLSNHPSSSSTTSAGRSLPYAQNRLAPRRPNTASTVVNPAGRRPSVPGYSSQNLLAVPGQPTGPVNNEDLYSGLSSFTFGAVQSSAPQSADTSELISPLTRVSDSRDHTPRPSISGPSGTKPSSKSRNGKQPATSDADMGDDEYDEDEDDHQRQKSRSKMRAIDDGSRRPSLPANIYMPDVPPASSSSSPPSDPQRHMSPSSNSEQDTSEPDVDDGGELDTDVEFDLHQHSGTEELVLPDDASQHTFGGGFDHYGFRGGNLLTSDQMSINEDDEDDSDARAASVSPVTFTQPGDDSEGGEGDHDRHSRRGTFPYNLPTATASFEDATSLARDRENSMATVTMRRASRSMDDDINVLPDTASTLTPGHSHFASFGPQDAVDMTPEPNLEPESDVYDGFRLDYILSDERRQSVSQTSFMERNKSNYLAASQEISPFSWMGVGSARRPSTVTVGTTAGEDVFTRHLRKNDEKYDSRRLDWSFKKESTDGRGPKHLLAPPSSDTTNARKSMTPGTQEIWRQAYIGRFKVDRLIMKTDQPDKAPQQRVNVRHVVDPFSKGNIRGGPSSVIHKHSRAVAFSIFRTHSLFKASSRRHATHMNTSVSILLATKKVQEQYTSTRTTAKLNSHGLLEDRADHAGTVFSPTTTATAPSVRAASRASSAHAGRRDKSQHRSHKHKTPADPANATGVGTSSQTASGYSVHSSSEASVTISPSRSPAPPSAPSSPSMKHPAAAHVPTHPTHMPTMSVSSNNTSTTETIRPSERATSLDAITHKGSFSMSSVSDTVHEQSTSSRSELGVEEAEEDTMDLDEQSPPRTSHAEAFATVDSNYLEYVRGRHDQRPHHHHQDHDSSHSLVGAFRRRFLGQSGNAKGRSSTHSSGPATAALEGHYTPPWLTMAPRSKVEERERVIQNLNESFKDVGLLPSFRPQRNHHEKHKRGKTNASTNIFANVPADCLYMLLPLWPGETDTTAAEHREDPNDYIIPVEQRQYLLVYYVPFDERSKKKRDKKRTREEVTKVQAHSSSGTQGTNISLQSFRVCARLVSYSDMRESGVRLPDYGLSITGSMTEAARYLPPPSIRDMSLDDIVIGVCHTRETGMEFLPEGLVKLGLCMPSEEPMRPLREDEEAEELDVNLTPIGRAAVEMAWLGSMAVTCFGSS